MGDNLCKHWDLLSIGEEEQAAFEASLAAPPGGISLATIRKGEAELKRLEELKAARMVELVRATRPRLLRIGWLGGRATRNILALSLSLVSVSCLLSRALSLSLSLFFPILSEWVGTSS